MTESKSEFKIPEFKTWSLDNFGQIIKVSGSLEPDVFPYKVLVSKNSTFFKNIYDGVYKGKNVTVFGSEKGKHPIKKGVIVEHMAILAANDLGEIMVSKEVFEGDTQQSLTDSSILKMNEHSKFMRKIPLPPGWRRFGDIHSHPIDDVENSFDIFSEKIPTVNNIRVTWSAQDFNCLVSPIKEGFTKDTVEALITPVQLSFMVATKKTIEILKKEDSKTDSLIDITSLRVPPYKNFEKLGIVLYAGNHLLKEKDFILQRLI